MCLRITTRAPKKPCSANRAIAKIAVRNKFHNKLFCYIPGEETKIKTNKLHKYSYVLLRPGRVNDLPGVRYKVIRAAKRNKYLPGPLFIKQYSRSKHSVKNDTRPKRIRRNYLKNKKK
jgi:ribosomal protein S12